MQLQWKNFINVLSALEESTKLKFNMEMLALKGKMDLADTYREILSSKYIKYSSPVHIEKTFFKIDHVLNHNKNLHNIRMIEIVSKSFQILMCLEWKSTTNQKKKTEYLEIKQFTVEQPQGNRRNQKANEKIPENK